MSENKKVTLFADVKNDSRLWSCEQCLNDLLGEINELNPEKMIIMFWYKNEEGQQRRSWRFVNLTRVEVAGYLAEAAHDALHEMRPNEQTD